MSHGHPSLPTSRLQSSEESQCSPSHKFPHVEYVSFFCCVYLPLKPTCDRPRRTSIHILDDNSLLNIFYFYRQPLCDGLKLEELAIFGGYEWEHEHWWYELVHVCRRWRHLILGSASYLSLCLRCTHGTPVADMLAHSPPLPIIIDHLVVDDDITSEDERATLLALQHRDRVRRIRLLVPISDSQDLIVAIDNEFPMLEYLCIGNTVDDPTAWMLPKTFQAPHLRYLTLIGVVCSVRSLLLTSAVGLVTLILRRIPPSAYFSPDDLISCISLLPQLEMFSITFLPPLPDHGLGTRSLQTPIMTCVTLPNLHWFGFKGTSAYLEELLPRIATPLLENFEIGFFDQSDISIPHVQHFMSTTEKFKFNCATLKFDDELISVEAYPSDQAGREPPFQASIDYGSFHPEPQITTMASLVQVLNVLRTLFSNVETLTFEDTMGPTPSHWQHFIDRAQWRGLLGPFSGVKTLNLPKGLVLVLSSSLQVLDGESPTDLFPELREILYPADRYYGGAFSSFLHARRNVGHPVTIVHR